MSELAELLKPDTIVTAGLVAFFWWWVRNISANIKELTKSVNELRVQLAEQYMTKEQCQLNHEGCDMHVEEFYRRINMAEKDIALIKASHDRQHGERL